MCYRTCWYDMSWNLVVWCAFKIIYTVYIGCLSLLANFNKRRRALCVGWFKVFYIVADVLWDVFNVLSYVTFKTYFYINLHIKSINKKILNIVMKVCHQRNGNLLPSLFYSQTCRVNYHYLFIYNYVIYPLKCFFYMPNLIILQNSICQNDI